MKLTLTFSRSSTPEEKLNKDLLDTRYLEALTRVLIESEFPRDYRLKRMVFSLVVFWAWFSLISVILWH